MQMENLAPITFLELDRYIPCNKCANLLPNKFIVLQITLKMRKP